jgi:predicted nucleotidyltransferase
MNSIITDNMDKIKTVCDQHHVKSLFAYGDVCTDKFNDNSEVELLVYFQPLGFDTYADNYFHAIDSFEKIFHHPVELTMEKAPALNNPYFVRSFNQTKTLLYGQ